MSGSKAMGITTETVKLDKSEVKIDKNDIVTIKDRRIDENKDNPKDLGRVIFVGENLIVTDYGYKIYIKPE